MNVWLLSGMGGLLAGVLHVLSGPDHLAAVLPFALRDRRSALKVGITWGLGHGVGVVILAVIALVLQSTVQLESFSNLAERIVGVLLVLVGAWTVKKSGVLHFHTHQHDHGSETHAHPQLDGGGHHHSVLGFGLLHGFAGGGHLLSVLPTLALGRVAALAYLVMFLLGGLGAMAAFAFFAGRVVRREAWVPKAVALAGAASIAVGVFWLASVGGPVGPS